MDHSLIKQTEAQGLICVTLDIHLWSGRKRLRKEALLAKNPEFSNLPPESLATLGSIKISDPDDLAPFASVKREAEKVLQVNGLPLLGTIGIPQGKLDRVHQRLLELQAQFEQLRSKLHRDFERRVQEWRQRPENEAWAHLINDIPTPEYVAGRLAFGFHLCRVSAPSTDAADPVNQGFGQQIGGLKGELFADAAREARLLMARYLGAGSGGSGGSGGVARERDRISHKTLGPLRRIADKLRSFSFLDPTVQPMAAVVDHCLSLLPKQGPIEGVHLVHIWSLARTLGNERAAEEAAAIAMQLSSPSDAFEQLLTKAAQEDHASPAGDAPAAGSQAAAPAVAAHPQAVNLDEIPPSEAANHEEFTPQLAGVFF